MTCAIHVWRTTTRAPSGTTRSTRCTAAPRSTDDFETSNHPRNTHKSSGPLAMFRALSVSCAVFVHDAAICSSRQRRPELGSTDTQRLQLLVSFSTNNIRRSVPTRCTRRYDRHRNTCCKSEQYRETLDLCFQVLDLQHVKSYHYEGNLIWRLTHQTSNMAG
ncbi:hypothetical protein BU25DRAFT_204562 [Macroventuria anomochaeta]|uniref:Uncharacterized protein n=1 Tax=Macroventuria anomochaeta TaxID=301207 RepID=A0ACB6RLU6_9PLEO|nr:uncharacterized protein BU25DRAFT_204562 [Macroventuria anomochaeta]KAF2622708.1 hypothetical protein BU25DRAFT_204562 [Macroventuria anomochaeta]